MWAYSLAQWGSRVALGLVGITLMGIITNNLCTAKNYHWATLHSHVANKVSINVNVFKSVWGRGEGGEGIWSVDVQKYTYGI